ncbi:DUF3667 domain-containing protein [Flavobacterium sp. N502540]|uniref:DUF3667 domain-containing protein n=1 Tax=Flavobacterium sp. N502540 TaxID=2986838 RepID=UPI0029CAB92C|nr:DUF3667 domain-containing protein [Flavobacterium sp. N502540]
MFVHFFEDLTHYENAFWRTIKNLLFKPSALTKEYLSGKRLSYLAPVRLYIFISFVTFLMIALFPGHSKETSADFDFDLKTDQKKEVPKNIFTGDLHDLKPGDGFDDFTKEIDSVQKYAPEKEKLNSFNYWMIQKVKYVKEHNTKKELINKFTEAFVHNIPKVLFIIMPLFAFILWLFHNKKKWYYFDHGIFTLHYFSFLLLIILLLFIIRRLVGLFGEDSPIAVISGITDFFGALWMFYYFFPAHHRFYGETRWVSFFKSTIILSLNFTLILFLLIIYVFYTFINLH